MDNSFFTFCNSVLWPEGVHSQAHELAPIAIQMLSQLLIPAGWLIRHGTAQENLLLKNACHEWHSTVGTSKIY